MALGGILVATLAAGCFGGGSGYSNNPYGYNSGYSTSGNSYPYSGYSSGYSYPQRYENSYDTGYQNGVRADDKGDRHQDRDIDQHAAVIRDRGEARTETRHSSVDSDKYSRNDSKQARDADKN